MPALSRQGSPVSEEDEAYPQTPPPQSNYFNIASEDTNTTLVNEPEIKDASVMCNACGLTVKDTYLELANNVYHKEVMTVIYS